MELRHFLRVLRGHWVFVACSVVLCVLGAAYLASAATPTYSAHTQFFVSDDSGLTDPSLTYQGGLFSQQRVLSYVQILTSPAILDPVIKKLHLKTNAQQLAAHIQAGVPTDTVLLNVTVQDHSARQALAIARSLDAQFATFVHTLESSRGGRSPVKVTVTNPAQLPTSPSSPRKAEYLAIGLILGLVIGVGGAFVLEALYRRIRWEGDAVRAARAPVFGFVAGGRGARMQAPIAVTKPTSDAADAYRRISIKLSAVVDDHGLRSISIASVMTGDANARVAANIAVLFAQAGYRTILIDADLRHPRLAQMFELPASQGLVDGVENRTNVESALQTWKPGLPLRIMTAGSESASGGDLLLRPRLQGLLETMLRQTDVVIFSSPPVLGSSDGTALARITSGTVLVARNGSTTFDDLTVAAESVRSVNALVLGVVLEGRVDAQSGGTLGNPAESTPTLQRPSVEASRPARAVGHSTDA